MNGFTTIVSVDQ